jgi:membrane-associated phospholipid phosphatase
MTAADLLSRARSSLFTRTTLALAAGVVAALAFLEITEEVLEGEATEFDRSVSLWVHGFDSPGMDKLMHALSFVGSVPVVIAMVVLVAAWALQRNARGLALVFVGVASAAEGLNLLLKQLYRRERPQLFFEAVQPDSFSFPSGHSMASAAAYGMAAFVVARLQPSWRVPVYVVTPVLVLCIGLSRIYLGMHWPTDVLAGFAAGALVLASGKLALGSVRTRERAPKVP